MQKEADGVYSFHSIANYPDGALESIYSSRTLVDSLGNEYRVDMGTSQSSSSLVDFHGNEHRVNPNTSQDSSGFTGVALTLDDFDLDLQMNLQIFRDANGNLSAGHYPFDTGFTLDTVGEQVVITLTGNGAQLIFDLSDTKAVYRGSKPVVVPGETLNWNFPSMILEEGVNRIWQELVFSFPSGDDFMVPLSVDKVGDGSFIGRLGQYIEAFFTEFYLDEEGRVSSYKFERNGGSTDDPSVGMEQTGAVVQGVHFVEGGIDYGTFNIDLSSLHIINRTGSDLKMVNGGTMKPDTSSGRTGSASTVSGTSLTEGTPGEAASAGDEAFALLSPSSVSIDEHGVLRRLKDNGDWEPVYLLACGQFAAMNSAEERNGVYYATPASGVLTTGVSGKDGMGTITSGTLERSTTDLAHELSEMIRAQHAYAANTKVLSTIDDMLTELERL
jgi:flagellar hook protein FlgE